MELGAHDAAALLRGTHAWSRPMDGTPSMSGERIGRASDATLATDICEGAHARSYFYSLHTSHQRTARQLTAHDSHQRTARQLTAHD